MERNAPYFSMVFSLRTMVWPCLRRSPETHVTTECPDHVLRRVPRPVASHPPKPLPAPSAGVPYVRH